MLIFWKHRLVFLANTKTGSTSIEAALEPLAHVTIARPPELKHMRAQKFHRFMAPMLEQAAGERFATVAVMREPVDWLGSWFRYRQRDELQGGAKSTAGLDFAAFVTAYLSDRPPPAAAVGSQARFLADGRGRPLVDHIFRYEDLAGFVRFLENLLGYEISLPRMNVSPSAPLDLPPALRRELRERLAPDYAIYEAISSGRAAG